MTISCSGTNPLLGVPARHRIGAMVAMVTLAACGTKEPRRDAEPVVTGVRRDSGGVEIVESERAVWKPGEEWTIDSTASVAIRDSGLSIYLLPKVFGDGTIGLTQDQAQRSTKDVGVFLYDSAGQYRSTLGRHGGGPGEFTQRPIFIDAGPDTIVCFQRDDRRLVWFTADGKVVRHITLDGFPAVDGFNIGNGSVQGIRSDGAFLVTIDDWMMNAGPGLHDWTRTIFIVRDSGRAVVPYGKFGLREMMIRARAGGGANPFQTERRAALGPDPLPVSVIGRTKWEVEQFGVDGKLRRVLRANIPRPKTPDSMAAFGKKEGFAVPDSLPAISIIQHDRAGHLWVGRYNTAPDAWMGLGIAQPKVFDVFEDSTGRWLGSVRVPGRIGMILDISKDYVAVQVEDEDDVPQVRLHRIRRGGR